MTSRLRHFALLLAAAALAPLAPAALLAQAPPADAAHDAAPDRRVSLAVMRFTNGAIGKANAELEPLAFGIPEVLVSEFAQDARIKLFERSRLDEVVREQMLADAQVVDASTAAKAGRLVGAQHVVFGGFVAARGDSIRVIARVVDVGSNTVEAVVTEQDHVDNLLPLLAATAAELTKKIAGLAGAGPSRAAAVADAPAAPFAAVLAYSRGLAALAAGDAVGGKARLLEAVAAAPEWKQPQDALARLARGGK